MAGSSGGVTREEEDETSLSCNLDLFEMIEKMQGCRMDEQRSSLPPPLKTEEDYIPYPGVHEVLGREGPFPLVLLPQFGGYWIEGTNHNLSQLPDPENNRSPSAKVKLESNRTARLYRKHFLGKEHYNYYSLDAALGHLIFSCSMTSSGIRSTSACCC
ncbi:rap1 GTPase-activating protein 1-like, partial [Rhinoderma darwinii]|uniref:rap1 GTPase-activating protein 1-like n=1 Tax=Rhinoderma darwinii TaxID=43563 RepID=UPI003F67BA88